MNFRTGFLLSYIKYGDSDAVLHCFTKEQGFQSFFVRGMYTSKSKKKSFLSPLNELQFTLNNYSKSSAMQSVTKLELVTNSLSVPDIRSSTVIFFVADFLNLMLRNENQNTEIYAEIQQLTQQIARNNYSAHHFFLLKFLQLSGLLPLITPEKYLNPESGTFTSEMTHHLFDEEISALWKTIISSNDYYAHQLSSDVKRKLLDSLLVYYHYHFSSFKTPGTLDVLKQIFS